MQNVIDKIEWMFAGLGGFLGWFFGGFDGFLYALVVFVVCDYFTGVLAAAIKHELSSEVGFKGIAKKVCIFVLVGIANIIDTQILQNGAAIRTAVKIKCAEAEAGVAYVLNSADTYAFTAGRIYTVVPGDNLWKIAEKKLGSGSRCADIRVLNGLTSNAIRVGMKLLIP